MLQKLFLFSVLVIFTAGAQAQELSQPVEQLRDYCKRSIPTGYSPRLNILSLTPKSNLHYLFPLYHGFRDEEKFKKIYSEKGYYDEMSQYFAFAGDYHTALQYLEKSFDSVDDDVRKKVYRTAAGLKNIEHVNARRYIGFAAKNRRVTMINEAFAKPLHRAFTLSLLADLYRQGYRYLAMEMLNNFSNQNLTKEGMHTGYYASEPVAGELVRFALEMGYTLVPYEDTAASVHTPNQRDSIQAEHLYSILQKDSSARILVHASFAHISKKQGADGRIPMALAFWRRSGIEPLTIDQTDMTEESNFGYGRVIYQAYLQKFPLKEPSIALINNAPVNVTDKDLYDLCVIHPPTVFQDGRPSWLNLGGRRQPTYIKPTSPAVYLVQAYYLDEIEHNDNTPWQLVPADQTYVTGGKKNYLLYLRKNKYKIFFRDINYKILSTLNIDVN
ncbi:MAG: hypothetical protein JST68_25790 [Bacteroidetes bacterium]|nr:hypothetical protein [Bacteroidota bacterium]